MIRQMNERSRIRCLVAISIKSNKSDTSIQWRWNDLLNRWGGFSGNLSGRKLRQPPTFQHVICNPSGIYLNLKYKAIKILEVSPGNDMHNSGVGEPF